VRLEQPKDLCAHAILFVGDSVKSLWIALLVLVPTTVAAQSKTPETVIKVKIEAPENSKQLLLRKLQVEAKDLGLVWHESAAGFDYGILLDIRDETNMRVSWCTVRATVHAADGKELFQFTAGGWSCLPATESVARGIIERLVRLRPDLLKRKSSTN
jgi:hypothetical protein